SPPAPLREDLLRPCQDPFGDVPVQRVAGELPRVQVVRKETCVVVEHLLEMRNDPTWIRRVPMEAPADLVVHAALRHRRKRAREDFLEAFLSRPVVAGHDPFHRPWVRELLLAGDTAVYGIELAAKR